MAGAALVLLVYLSSSSSHYTVEGDRSRAPKTCQLLGGSRGVREALQMPSFFPGPSWSHL